MRELPLPFIAWTYGAVPRLVETAALRPWKFAKWAVLLYALNAAGEKYGPGNTAKERALMPPYQQGTLYGIPGAPPQQIKLPSGLGTDQGQYLDVTRFIPAGDVLDTADSGKMIPGLPSPLQPSFGVLGSGIQAITGTDWFTGRKIAGLGVSNQSDAELKGRFFLRQMLPNNPLVPGSYSGRKVAAAVRGRPSSPLADVLPVWQAVAQTLGLKIRPADLQKMVLRADADAKRKMEGLGELMRAAALDLRAGRITPEEYQRQFRENMAVGQSIMRDLQAKLQK